MIAIGSDHGGFVLKQEIMEHLKENGIEYKDYGCYDESSCDYPVYAKKVANAIVSGECELSLIHIYKIFEKYEPALFCATKGKNGSTAYYKGKSFFADAFVRKDTVETTGAGDTFMACILNSVLEKGLDNLTKSCLLYTSYILLYH